MRFVALGVMLAMTSIIVGDGLGCWSVVGGLRWYVMVANIAAVTTILYVYFLVDRRGPKSLLSSAKVAKLTPSATDD